MQNGPAPWINQCGQAVHNHPWGHYRANPAYTEYRAACEAEQAQELERKRAEFKKVEKVVVFQSGFAANAGTVSAIFGKEDVVISDELNHASIIDGCRLSRATIKVFPHKDVDAARKIIKVRPVKATKDAVA